MVVAGTDTGVDIDMKVEVVVLVGSLDRPSRLTQLAVPHTFPHLMALVVRHAS
jgi:hypothetical protein